MEYHHAPSRMAKTLKSGQYQVLTRMESNENSYTLLIELQMAHCGNTSASSTNFEDNACL